MHDIDINVHHIARVEGHGNIVIDVKKGEIREIKLEIVEAPRFFEAMLVGRRFPEAPHITARICGICSIGHTIASLRAIEDALGIEPTEQTVILRKIALEAEILQSHVLHYYFLAAPDFLKVPSVFPLAASHPDVVKRAVRIKKLSDDICTLVAGRHPQPVSLVVDGVTNLPSESGIKEAVSRLKEVLKKDMPPTMDFFNSISIPDFERKTDYVSLVSDKEYPFYNGEIYSSETGFVSHRDYKNKVKEEVVLHSTAKHVKGPFKPYTVSALARLNNNNIERLMPKAKEAVKRLGLKVPNYNPFNNNLAQVVESVHNIESMIYNFETLLSRGIKDERAGRGIAGWLTKLPKSEKSWGVGAVEVPRGILFHEYKIDEDGLITSSNCIIPTGQNLANIEADMHAYVPQILDRPKDEITLLLEMLVRAYDPCISCSSHLLEVKFVE